MVVLVGLLREDGWCTGSVVFQEITVRITDADISRGHRMMDSLVTHCDGSGLLVVHHGFAFPFIPRRCLMLWWFGRDRKESNFALFGGKLDQ